MWRIPPHTCSMEAGTGEGAAGRGWEGEGAASPSSSITARRLCLRDLSPPMSPVINVFTSKEAPWTLKGSEWSSSVTCAPSREETHPPPSRLSRLWTAVRTDLVAAQEYKLASHEHVHVCTYLRAPAPVNTFPRHEGVTGSIKRPGRSWSYTAICEYLYVQSVCWKTAAAPLVGSPPPPRSRLQMFCHPEKGGDTIGGCPQLGIRRFGEDTWKPRTEMHLTKVSLTHKTTLGEVTFCCLCFLLL